MVPFFGGAFEGAFTDEATPVEDTAAGVELAADAAGNSFARPTLYVRN